MGVPIDVSGHKNLRNIIHELIHEGRGDRETTWVSRWSMNVIKRFFSLPERRNKDSFSAFQSLRLLGELTHFEIRIVKHDNLSSNFTVSGTASSQDSPYFVTIVLHLSPSVFKGDIPSISHYLFAPIQSKLKQIIKHEIEHTLDQIQGKINPEDRVRVLTKANDPGSSAAARIESFVRYLLSPHEVRAWVAGMYKQAKNDRVPLKDVMRQSAGKFWYDPRFQPVIKAWRSEARRRFPKIRDQSSF